MGNSRKVFTCKYCSSSKLTKFISLGNHPPSNSFIKASGIKNEKKYPLELLFCESCSLVQLSEVVSPDVIFNKYLYLSSSSKALQNHYRDLANTLTKEFSLKKNNLVVDIGCNDGILLNEFNSTFTRVGVEPSTVAKIAKSLGLSVVQKFFSPNVAERIVKKYGKASIATATNVFAHVDDIENFVSGLTILLEKKGVFVIEAPYLIDMIDHSYFDTIYHEHLCYLSLTPLKQFLSKFALDIFKVERIPFGASGPAIRVFVGFKGERPIENSVTDMLRKEKKWGVERIQTYTKFAKNVEQIKKNVLIIINKLKKNGYKVYGYTAPAKGNTLLNFFSLSSNEITNIAETNPLKKGLVTPGSHIPIISEEIFLEQSPKYALLLSWNYIDFFLKQSAFIKNGGKFLIPLPKPYVTS